jgi:hypothetical protein
MAMVARGYQGDARSAETFKFALRRHSWPVWRPPSSHRGWTVSSLVDLSVSGTASATGGAYAPNGSLTTPITTVRKGRAERGRRERRGSKRC